MRLVPALWSCIVGGPIYPLMPPSGEPPLQVFVRRGRVRRYLGFKSDAANLPVTVNWDRREGARRFATGEVRVERRQDDRRKTPPFTWDLADFVVAEPEE